MKFEGVLEEVHLQEDEARSDKREQDEPRLRSTMIATTLTPSRTMEHFSDPIILPRAPERQAQVDGLNPAALGVAEEDVLGLERGKLGAGLVVADAKEIVVRHARKAGDEGTVVIVVVPTCTILKGGRLGGVSRGGSIVLSGSRRRKWTL